LCSFATGAAIEDYCRSSKDKDRRSKLWFGVVDVGLFWCVVICFVVMDFMILVPFVLRSAWYYGAKGIVFEKNQKK